MAAILPELYKNNLLGYREKEKKKKKDGRPVHSPNATRMTSQKNKWTKPT